MNIRQRREVLDAIKEFRAEVDEGGVTQVGEALDKVMGKAQEAGLTDEQLRKLQEEGKL